LTVTKRLPPVHPGEILREEVMAPIGLSANRLAKDLGIPTSRVLEIINGRRSISADTALRLGRYFGTTAQLWINLQASYDLEAASDANGKGIERAVKPREVAVGSR
jgi:antitoxin HigA-1